MCKQIEEHLGGLVIDGVRWKKKISYPTLSPSIIMCKGGIAILNYGCVPSITNQS
jgi:hypothetical protein